MKKLLNFTLLLLALLLPATATAHDFCVDGIYYNINGNEATVTYMGTSSWNHNTYYGDVTIPSAVIYNGTTYSVTTIGASAFENCNGLTSVTIPNSVTSIDFFAFYGCTGLTSITIPDSVTTIGDGAFGGCSGLLNIDIPNTIRSIDLGAFSGTAWFESQPEGVVYAGLIALTYKGSLPDSVIIREGTLGIADYAFNESFTGFRSVKIPNSVIFIGKCAFNCCTNLTDAEIPNSVTSIGEWAFSETRLTNVIIPESVSIINDGVFYKCVDLVNVNIPNSVTSIGTDAFHDCSSLTSITIPNKVNAIWDGAFYNCNSLTSISIPNSVTDIGPSAFGGCTGLKNVYSYIENPTAINIEYGFWSDDYGNRTLHVPFGTLEAYQADERWSQYFGNIVEMDPIPAESIMLDKSSAVVTVGETLQLRATVLPHEAYDKSVAWASSNPGVATVDGNGLVTAMSVGTATITAMTTDGSNLSASCNVTVRNLSSTECFAVEDTTVMHGETFVIPVAMVNDASIIAFQTDIFLPEGLEIVKEDGEYVIDPSERMTRTHTIMSDDVSNGAVRVLCYSSNYKPFTGESGNDLFYITVKAADDAAGDYTISLKNTLLTNTDFVDIAAPDVAANVHVLAYLLGDANNSGTVTVTDVVVTAQYVLERNPEPFVFDAADVNADGNITVADVSRIAWMVLNENAAQEALLHAPALWNVADRLSAEGITLQPGQTRRVSFTLDNALEYSAFQLDLMLPEGLTASNFALTHRAGNHALDMNTLDNGAARVLCYSPAVDAISGHKGALLTFDVTANGPVAGEITVDGIELVTTDCQTVMMDAFTIGVNTFTAVNELNAEKPVERVEYYNLAGQRLSQPTSGVTLIVTTHTDGTRTTTKIIK